jgi:hypothetical protein
MSLVSGDPGVPMSHRMEFRLSESLSRIFLSHDRIRLSKSLSRTFLSYDGISAIMEPFTNFSHGGTNKTHDLG